MAGTSAVKLNFYNAKNSLETFHDLYVLCGFGCEIIKGTTVLRFIFDTVFSFTKTSLPLITISSSCRSARIGKLIFLQWFWKVTWSKFSPAGISFGSIGGCGVALLAFRTVLPKYTFFTVHIKVRSYHRGVAVVEVHGEVGAALDGGDLGCARTFSRCAIREAICQS